VLIGGENASTIRAPMRYRRGAIASRNNPDAHRVTGDLKNYVRSASHWGQKSMNDKIVPIRMPKWGLSMQEGQLVSWLKKPGQRFKEGEDIAEVETSKINNVYEAPTTGLLRRVVVAEGETVPVGALLAVAAEEDVDDADIDAFVEEFQSNFVPDTEDGAGQSGLQVQTISTFNGTLNVGVAGSGDSSVVLIHGFSGDLNGWLLNLEPLMTQRRVIAIDLPGHGSSYKQLKSGSLEELAEAVVAVMDKLDVQVAHLVGHSLGGAVARTVASEHPDRVQSLTLVAPAGLPGGKVDPEFINGMVTAERARDLKPLLELLFADPSLVSSDMIEGMARYKRIDGVEDALAAIRDHSLSPQALEPGAKALGERHPTLLVFGEEDRIVGIPDRSALPASWRVESFAKVGHMPQLERASDFNGVVQKFLDDNR
jgi:pyruvate dehydrogenase E2 component (dihydrolipoamide acetyltransferase)